MAITDAHAGRRYPPTPEYEVTAGKIAEFAAALGQAPAGAGSSAAAAPPTFAAVVAATAWQAMFDDPELGLALRRIVHGDQRFTFVRPLRAGDRVSAFLVLDKVRTRGSADIITASVEIRDADDEVVTVATATFFHTREATPDGAAA